MISYFLWKLVAQQGFEPYQRVLITRRRAFKGVGTGVHEMAKQELI